MVYTVGIEESLKKIFSAVVIGAIRRDNPKLADKKRVCRECIPRFIAKFNDNIFQDEYAFIYEMLKTLKIKVFSITQLREVIDRNRDIILDSPYINISKWGITIDNRPTTDDEKIEAFTYNMISLVEELSNNYVTEQEFSSSVEIFVAYYIEQASLETVQNMALILSDTGLLVRKSKKRSVLYKGVEDSDKYYLERKSIIKSLSSSDINSTKSELIGVDWLSSELKLENKIDDEGILDFGLTEIDTVIGELRRSNLVTVLGPPKGGKTRLTNYLVQRALDKGLNVCVWPLEGTKEEWIASQISNMLRVHHNIYVNSKDILQRKYENEQVRECVIAEKTRLATDYSRGKLSFITGTAYCENFTDELENHYNNINAFDVLVIDQLVNISTKTGKNKVDRISTAYMQCKDFITNKLPRKALAIMPAQLKQDTVDYLRRNPSETMDVTAGGESAETIRSADEVIGIFSTKEERSSNRIRLYSVASRHSESFDDFYAHAELGCCYFESDSSLND